MTDNCGVEYASDTLDPSTLTDVSAAWLFGRVVAPREGEMVDDLPHTGSGRITRRLLKAHDVGLAEGGTSTLEAHV